MTGRRQRDYSARHLDAQIRAVRIGVWFFVALGVAVPAAILYAVTR